MNFIDILDGRYGKATIRYMRVARAASKESDHRTQMGAALVKKGQIVATGRNFQFKTHPRMTNGLKRVHAEVDAVIGVSSDKLRKATIYVFRERKDTELAMARPCDICRTVLKRAGIKWMIYTSGDEDDPIAWEDL